MPIIVNLAKEPDLEININLHNLKIGDWGKLKSADADNLDDEEFLDFLDTMIEGDVRELPITAMVPILEAMTKAIEGAENPEVDGKN